MAEMPELPNWEKLYLFCPIHPIRRKYLNLTCTCLLANTCVTGYSFRQYLRSLLCLSSYVNLSDSVYLTN